ncbi:MAG TPA: OmpH family outer membrane protein [Kofleriaceae bacterium]|jgi:outer membrane protein|nr:OmpH family outer membrane protein [Kofleriaceae bacterium]
MKRLSLVLAVLGCGVAVSPFVAASFAAAAGGSTATKIGVIDIEKTLYETPAGKRASDKFDKARQAKEAELAKQQKELEKDAADLDKQASMYKPDVLKQKRDDLEKKFVDLQTAAAKAERELAGQRATLVQDILKQANPIIEDIAKQEGVDLIVERGSVLWVDKTLDLTDKLNAKMK